MVYVVQQQLGVKKAARATRTLVPVLVQYLLAPDSFSTVFAFLEACPSLVDMLQGDGDSLGVVVLVVAVAPGIPRSLTRRIRQQHVYDSHTYLTRFPLGRGYVGTKRRRP